MLQKSDLRLKQGLIIHTVLYGIHFALLGLPTAVVSCVTNHVVDLHTISALRCRTNHHQRCDGFSAFAVCSRFRWQQASCWRCHCSDLTESNCASDYWRLPFFGSFITSTFRAGAEFVLRLVFVYRRYGVSGLWFESRTKNQRRKFVFNVGWIRRRYRKFRFLSDGLFLIQAFCRSTCNFSRLFLFLELNWLHKISRTFPIRLAYHHFVFYTPLLIPFL